MNKLPPTAPRACAETLVIVFSAVPKLGHVTGSACSHTPLLPQMHTSRCSSHLKHTKNLSQAVPHSDFQRPSGRCTSQTRAQVDDARLKLAGAFNSHVSPITQFFCSFGSKSNLWSVPSRISYLLRALRLCRIDWSTKPQVEKDSLQGTGHPRHVTFWRRSHCLCLKSDHVRTDPKKKMQNWAERTQDCHHNRRQQPQNWPHTVLTTVLNSAKMQRTTAKKR